MFREKYRDVRVEVAVREALEFSNRIRVWGWIFGATGTAILAVVALTGVPESWLIVTSFGIVVVLLTQALAIIAERNTAALSYLEVVCAGIDERTERM